MTKPDSRTDASFSDQLKTLPQYPLPHHLLSGLMFRIARIKFGPVKNWIIESVIKDYEVNMSEAAEEDPTVYEHFNAFFTRELKPGARPIAEGDQTVCMPADGRISQLGTIEEGRIFQAKGQGFSVNELLGGGFNWAEAFRQGQFVTVYLSPRDYHRVHMPITGTLKEMVYVPGRLFSVAPHNVRATPRLFARNERVVTLWETELGPMAQVLVGAIFVGSMDTVWAGMVAPPRRKTIQRWHYDDGPRIEKGDEMGRFNMGSTVITLFGRDALSFDPSLKPESLVLMGQALGSAR
ncbi:MAG: archaetidylserine decarboxylase [Gammaproteobacteria bacterium]